LSLVTCSEFRKRLSESPTAGASHVGWNFEKAKPNQKRSNHMLRKALFLILFAASVAAVANVPGHDPWPDCLPCLASN